MSRKWINAQYSLYYISLSYHSVQDFQVISEIMIFKAYLEDTFPLLWLFNLSTKCEQNGFIRIIDYLLSP